MKQAVELHCGEEGHKVIRLHGIDKEEAEGIFRFLNWTSFAATDGCRGFESASIYLGDVQIVLFT